MSTPEDVFADKLADARRRQDERARRGAELKEEFSLMQQAQDAKVMPRTRGWLTDVSASAARGPLKALRSAYSAIAGVAESITERTGDLQLNIGNGRPLFEALSPTEARALNAGADLTEQGIDAATSALGAPQTNTGAVAESITQFVTGLIPVARLAKAGNILQGTAGAVVAARGLLTGAVTSAIAFEGHEQNLANLIQSFPALSNPVTEFLATDGDDSEVTGRLKNAVTDAAGGAVVEGFIAGLKGLKAIRRAKGEEAAYQAEGQPQASLEASPAVDPSTPNASPAVTPEATPAAREMRDLNLDDVRLADDEPKVTAIDDAAAKPSGDVASDVAGDVPAKALSDTAGEPEGIDYGKLSDDDAVMQLAAKLGIDADKLAAVRKAVGEGEVQPERIADLIGINGERIDWSNVSDSEGMVGLLNSVTRVMDDAVGNAAGYTRVSIDDIAAHASSMGGSYDEAVSLWERMRDAPAAVMAQRATLMASAQRLHRLAKSVRDGVATNAEKLELLVHDRRHALLQTVARGTRAEIGRSLRVMREGVTVNESALKLSRAKQLREQRVAKEAADKTGQLVTLPEIPTGVMSDGDLSRALEAAGMSLGDLNQLADELAKRTDLDGLNAAARTGVLHAVGSGMKRLTSLYINNLLSGLPTLAINVTSAMQRVVETVVEKYGAHAIGMRGMDKWERTVANRSTVALATSFRNAWTMAGKAWKEGLPQVDIEARAEATRHGSQAIFGQRHIDAVLTAPSRAILTIDEFAKGLFYHQELMARAVEVAAHAARLAGADGDRVFNETLEQTLRNPPDDLVLDAVEHARRSTFQEALTNETLLSINGLLNSVPVMRLAVPFFRTPVNLLWQGFAERTPLGLLSRKVRDEMKLPGRKGREAQTRMMLGTAAIGTFTALADEGRVTGSRRGGRDSAALDGAPAYSIKIGDTWYQYNRFDPIGTVLGVAVEARRLIEHGEEGESIASGLVALTVQNLTDKTFFKGLSDFMEAVQGVGEGKGTDALKRYGGNIAANFMPYSSMLRNLAKQHDDIAREAWGFIDKLKANTPFMSEGLPVKFDVLGRPVKNTERIGPNFLSPFVIGKDDPDPVARELAALDITYRPLEKNVGGVHLTPAQYSRLTELTGKRLHDSLGEWVKSADWKNAGQPLRAEIFDRLYSSARAAGKAQLYEEDAALLQKVQGAKESARAVLLGQ